MKIGGEDFDREAGEAGAGAYINYVLGRWWLVVGQQLVGREEGFAEMSGYDTFFIAHRGQVHTGIPVE